MEIHRGLPNRPDSATAVFSIQSLTQPVSGVVVHSPVRPADRAEAEIIAPAAQGSIQVFNHHPSRLSIGIPPGHLADGLAESTHLFVGRPCADEGPSSPRSVAPSQGVPDKGETLVRHPASARLLLIHRELELGYDVLHLTPGFRYIAAAKNHEVVRINHQPRPQLLLPSPLHPSTNRRM
jgi:hypothetical protein